MGLAMLGKKIPFEFHITLLYVKLKIFEKFYTTNFFENILKNKI